MKVKNIKTLDMFVFLRNLQSLRSGFLAHSFSKSNIPCKQAIEYFGINNNNYIEVAKVIFQKSIATMNMLELEFSLKET